MKEKVSANESNDLKELKERCELQRRTNINGNSDKSREMRAVMFNKKLTRWL